MELTVKLIRGPILGGRTRSEDREQKAGRPLLMAVGPPERGSKIAGQQENQPATSKAHALKRWRGRPDVSDSKESEYFVGGGVTGARVVAESMREVGFECPAPRLKRECHPNRLNTIYY